MSNAPPTKFAGSADSAMPKADTYPARESVRDGRTKRRVLEDRDRRTAEQRAAAAARKTASIHAASRIPSTQELHSRPAKVPRAARAEETESSATDSDEEVNTQASICAYCTHVLPSEL